MIRPTSVEDLRDIVGQSQQLWIAGLNTKRSFRTEPPGGATLLSMAGLSGIVAIQPEDQVAIAWAGTPIAEFQSALAEKGQRLPILGTRPDSSANWCVAGMPGTLGGWLAMDMPHAWPGYGPRRMLLGATLLRPDGTLAKAGSHAVKSVAGYDVHKFLVGTRGTLALFVQVIVQTLPLSGESHPNPGWVRREPDRVTAVVTTSPNQFDEAVSRHEPNLFAVAREVSTLWLDGPGSPNEGDRTLSTEPVLLGRAAWPGGVRVPEAEHRLMKRAKATFDPTGKLNPGEFGL